MAGILSSHNKKILSEKRDKPDPPSCHCRKTPCLMSGRCREKMIVYKATVNCNNKAKNYFGLCETKFKARHYNHVQSFRHRQKSNATELSKYVWSCRDAGYELTNAWSIVCHAKPYQQGDKQCQLCLAKKYSILTADPSTTLNKRTELVNKCRHKNKYKLKNCKLKTQSLVIIFFRLRLGIEGLSYSSLEPPTTSIYSICYCLLPTSSFHVTLLLSLVLFKFCASSV